MPTINYSAALPPDIYTQNSAGAVNLGNYINTLRSDISFLIKQLFANSEQGFANDPNDFSTMFQDAAGTIPVTAAGQPLGLCLDKSKGLVLSSEILNQTLDFNLWSKTAAVTSAGIKTFTTNAAGGCSFGIFGAGNKKVYAITLTGTSTISGVLRSGSTTNGSISFNAGNVSITSYNSVISNDGPSIYIQLNAAGTFTVTSFSIKEILGNHASQTTSSMRPLLQSPPQKIHYDGIDDKLTTTLAAQLTGCTVIRSVPNVGTQILTNQTIPTPYNDATDHCGLIVINRALTALETAQITTLFNKRAGV